MGIGDTGISKGGILMASETEQTRQATQDDLMRRLEWHLNTARKHTSIIQEINTVAHIVSELTMDAVVKESYSDTELIRVGKELHVLSSLYIIACDRQNEGEL